MRDEGTFHFRVFEDNLLLSVFRRCIGQKTNVAHDEIVFSSKELLSFSKPESTTTLKNISPSQSEAPRPLPIRMLPAVISVISVLAILLHRSEKCNPLRAFFASCSSIF